MKNFKQIVRSNDEIREEWGELVGDFYLDSSDEEHKEIFPELCKFGIIIEEEDHYGGEDCGSEYWYVFSVEKDGIKTFYKLEGWYQSYDGVTWDDKTDFYEVEEKEVMVKQWVKV